MREARSQEYIVFVYDSTYAILWKTQSLVIESKCIVAFRQRMRWWEGAEVRITKEDLGCEEYIH